MGCNIGLGSAESSLALLQKEVLLGDDVRNFPVRAHCARLSAARISVFGGMISGHPLSVLPLFHGRQALASWTLCKPWCCQKGKV
eukprot:1148595-Pelagomonas_calceolata.AAC.2